MSTIDRVDRFQECSCSEGKVRVTECSPDHPYAKSSQTWYTAEFECNTCKKSYQIDDSEIDGERYIVLRSNTSEEPMIKLSKIDFFCEGLTK
jgi:hypothetical protein